MSVRTKGYFELLDGLLARYLDAQEARFALDFRFRREVVATDGPVNEARQSALIAVAMEAGFGEHQVAFVTAYADRDYGAFKGSVSELAWRSFAWFMSEPDHIMVLHRGADADRALLSQLMRG